MRDVGAAAKRPPPHLLSWPFAGEERPGSGKGHDRPHDNPTDTGALHPLLAQARAVLDAAGIPAPPARPPSTPGTPATPRPSCTSPSPAKACKPAAATGPSLSPPCPAGRTWPPAGHPLGKAVYKKRAATIEPVFAQLHQQARTGAELPRRPRRRRTAPAGRQPQPAQGHHRAGSPLGPGSPRGPGHCLTTVPPGPRRQPAAQQRREHAHTPPDQPEDPSSVAGTCTRPA